ncbi:unnamed protein product [Closterium sp. NIES-64]|nr:unnamed protein product [Closterium sp. NIES-64]
MAATTTSLRLAPACATLRADPAHSLKGATTVKAGPKRQRAGAARAAMMEAPPVPMKSHEEKNLYVPPSLSLRPFLPCFPFHSAFDSLAPPHIEQIKALSLVTAIKTPYLPDGRFDIDAYDYLVHHQIENGTEAIIVGGTTGEGHLMSWDEHVMLIAHTVNCFGDQLKVIGNTGSNSTGEAMHATEQGFAVGMHAALQINPYYGKTSVDGIIQHYKAVLPMGPAIIYNVPGRTGTDLTPDVIEELAQHENFAGVKECVGNDRVSTHTSKGIVVWSGNDDQCHDAKWKHGANGVISVLSNLVPGKFRPEIGKDSKSKPIPAPSVSHTTMPLPTALNAALVPTPLSRGMPTPPLSIPLLAPSTCTSSLLQRLMLPASLPPSGLVHEMLTTGPHPELNAKLAPLTKWLFLEPNPIGLSTALCQLGLVRPVFRLPYTPYNEARRREFVEIVNNIGLEHFIGAKEVRALKDDDFHLITRFY